MKNIFKKEAAKNIFKKAAKLVKDHPEIATVSFTFVTVTVAGAISGIILKDTVYNRGVHKGIMDTTNAFNKIGVTDGYYICSQSTNDGEIYRVTHGKSADGKIVPMGRMFNSIVGCCMEHDETDDTSFDIENYLDSGVNVSAELSDKVECIGDYVEFKPTE